MLFRSPEKRRCVLQTSNVLFGVMGSESDCAVAVVLFFPLEEVEKSCNGMLRLSSATYVVLVSVRRRIEWSPDAVREW